MSSRPMPCSRCSVLQQIEDLRLDRHVERGRRLVGDQEIGLGRQRHGDHDALLLAAGEPERIFVDAPLRLRDADAAQPFDRLGARRRAAQRPCAPRSPRRSASPTRITGLRLVPGSWKIMPMRPPRIARMPRLGQAEQVLAVEVEPAVRRRGRSRAAAASAPAPSCSCRSPTRRPARRSRRASIASVQAVDRLDEAGVGIERDLEVRSISSVRRSRYS